MVIPPFLLILVQPFFYRWIPGGMGMIGLYDWQRIVCVGTLMVTVLLIQVFAGKKIGCWLNGDWLILGCAILAWGMASLVLNGVPDWNGLRELADAALLMVAFWSISFGLIRLEPEKWQGMVSLCLAGSALLYLAVFFEVNTGYMVSAEFVADGVWFPGFANIRFFSDYQALVFPFVVHWIARCRQSTWRAIVLVGAAFFLMLFFYSGSRVFVLGQIGAHLTLLLVLKRRYWSILIRHAQAWVAAYLLFLFFSVFVPFLLLEGRTEIAVLPLLRSGLSLREVLWSLAWGDILANPWFGIGPGEFARQLNPVAAGPHNSILMIGAEWGLPVLGLLLAAVIMLCRQILRALQKSESSKTRDQSTFDFMVAACLAFFALLLHSLVANVLVIPVSQLALLLAACLVYACSARRAVPVGISRWMWRGGGYSVLCLVTVVTMLVLLSQDIPQLSKRNASYSECRYPTSFFSPRFWQQGWLLEGVKIECPKLGH